MDYRPRLALSKNKRLSRIDVVLRVIKRSYFRLISLSICKMMIVVGLLFLFIGLGVLVNGIFSAFKTQRQVAGSAKATGTVVNFGRMMGKSGYIYCPQVFFADATGQRIEFQSELGTQPPSYTIGQQVGVIYQKNNPRQAEINSLMALWFAPGCIIAMALLFTAMGVTLFGLGVLVALNY